MSVYCSREKVTVTFLLDFYRIEGDIHLATGSRLTDVINVKTKDFLPVTDAKVFSTAGELVYSLSFMIVNRDAVLAIFPKEDLLFTEEAEQ